MVQAHADLSNMAATATGCTVCEGCFHSTATTLFLAGSLPHYNSTETGFSTKTILPSALLFAPQVSIKTQVAKQTTCRQSEEKASVIYTIYLFSVLLPWMRYELGSGVYTGMSYRILLEGVQLYVTSRHAF